MNLDQLAEFIANVERICKWNTIAFGEIGKTFEGICLSTSLENHINLCEIGQEQNVVLVEACKALTETKKDEIIN